jgi:hypothetical protein
MKKTFMKVVAVVATMVAGLNIASAQVSKDETQMIQGIWGMEKRAMLNEFMQFTPDEVTKFGPIYDAYMEEHKKLGAERINIISEYINTYGTADDMKIDNLMTRLLKNNEGLDKLQMKYYAKAKKALGAKRAAQFVQFEIYVQTTIKAQIQSNIPFIGELDKKAHH